MGLTTCKLCKKGVNSKLKHCPFCGNRLPSYKMIWIFAITVIVIVSIFSHKPSNIKISEQTPVIDNGWMQEDNSTLAYLMMQDFVEKTLKAPSTAKFPRRYDGPKIVKLKNQQYLIESWVDAQNSFGAMIRTRFTCIIKQVDNDYWRLVSLKTHN